MTGADLKRLASTSGVARLDFGEASLELVSDGQQLSAMYLGGFVLARASVREEMPTFAVSVHADQFHRLVNLFPDDETVSITVLNEATVTFTTSAKKTLRLNCAKVVPELLSAEPNEVTFSATVEARTLQQEVALAAGFVADETSSQQLLTGVRLLRNNDRLGVMAYDGVTALMTSSVAPKEISGEGSVTVPATELVNGFKLLDGEVRLQATEHRLFLISDTARFDSVAFDRKWPENLLDRVKGLKDYAFSITLNTDDLRTILSAAKTLDSYKVFEIEASGTHVSVRTLNSAYGQFNVETENKAEATGTWRYSIKALANIVRLGNPITLQIPTNPDNPTFVRVGARRVWFNSYRWAK